MMVAKKITDRLIRETALDPQLMKEIQRALELMHRVRMTRVGQAEKALGSERGNKYVLPKPLTLHASGSAQCD